MQSLLQFYNKGVHFKNVGYQMNKYIYVYECIYSIYKYI